MLVPLLPFSGTRTNHHLQHMVLFMWLNTFTQHTWWREATHVVSVWITSGACGSFEVCCVILDFTDSGVNREGNGSTPQSTMADIKNFLYAWCGKKKLTPTYDIRAAGNKNRQKFMCEVSSVLWPLESCFQTCTELWIFSSTYVRTQMSESIASP